MHYVTNDVTRAHDVKVKVIFNRIEWNGKTITVGAKTKKRTS